MKNALKRKENKMEETVKNTKEKLREIKEIIKNSLGTFRMQREKEVFFVKGKLLTKWEKSNN